MRNLIHALAVALLLSVSTQTAGRDREQHYRVEGVFSCDRYAADRKNTKLADSPEYYWVAGYITAYNMRAPNTYSILGKGDLKTTLVWLDKYCKANPKSYLHQGMMALLPELYPKRYQVGKGAAK